MSVLDEINARKSEHVQAQKSLISLDKLKDIIKESPAPRGFFSALKNAPTPAVIAEVKKASPSKGVIREDFDPVDIARIYEQSGATCLSVLTDEPYFQGCDDYLKQIRKTATLPLLRKDFMIDPYQIYESRALGADCILLIMAALSDEKAKTLYDLSCDLDMDVLVEVHNKEELERALLLNPQIIGVNNRNLKTLEVNLQTSHDLSDFIPQNTLKISESGINSPETIKELQNSGYNTFLIGESLMRQPCISTALQKLIDT